MAMTPFLGDLGAFISARIEERSGFSHYSGDDTEAEAIKKDLADNSDFVIVCGYGTTGTMVCSMLDRRFTRYVALDKSPQRAIEARNKGLPVFYGDITRPEVLASFGAGNARACVVTIDDMSSTNRAVISLRKNFPNLPLIVRAKDAAHKVSSVSCVICVVFHVSCVMYHVVPSTTPYTPCSYPKILIFSFLSPSF